MKQNIPIHIRLQQSLSNSLYSHQSIKTKNSAHQKLVNSRQSHYTNLNEQKLNLPNCREILHVIDLCTQLSSDNRLLLRNQIKHFFTSNFISFDQPVFAEQLIKIFVMANQKKLLQRFQYSQQSMRWIQVELRKYVKKWKQHQDKLQLQRFINRSQSKQILNHNMHQSQSRNNNMSQSKSINNHMNQSKLINNHMNQSKSRNLNNSIHMFNNSKNKQKISNQYVNESLRNSLSAKKQRIQKFKQLNNDIFNYPYKKDSLTLNNSRNQHKLSKSYQSLVNISMLKLSRASKDSINSLKRLKKNIQQSRDESRQKWNKIPQQYRHLLKKQKTNIKLKVIKTKTTKQLKKYQLKQPFTFENKRMSYQKSKDQQKYKNNFITIKQSKNNSNNGSLKNFNVQKNNQFQIRKNYILDSLDRQEQKQSKYYFQNTSHFKNLNIKGNTNIVKSNNNIIKNNKNQTKSNKNITKDNKNITKDNNNITKNNNNIIKNNNNITNDNSNIVKDNTNAINSKNNKIKKQYSNQLINDSSSQIDALKKFKQTSLNLQQFLKSNSISSVTTNQTIPTLSTTLINKNISSYNMAIQNQNSLHNNYLNNSINSTYFYANQQKDSTRDGIFTSPELLRQCKVFIQNSKSKAKHQHMIQSYDMPHISYDTPHISDTSHINHTSYINNKSHINNISHINNKSYANDTSHINNISHINGSIFYKDQLAQSFMISDVKKIKQEIMNSKTHFTNTQKSNVKTNQKPIIPNKIYQQKYYPLNFQKSYNHNYSQSYQVLDEDQLNQSNKSSNHYNNNENSNNVQFKQQKYFNPFKKTTNQFQNPAQESFTKDRLYDRYSLVDNQNSTLNYQNQLVNYQHQLVNYQDSLANYQDSLVNSINLSAKQNINSHSIHEISKKTSPRKQLIQKFPPTPTFFASKKQRAQPTLEINSLIDFIQKYFNKCDQKQQIINLKAFIQQISINKQVKPHLNQMITQIEQKLINKNQLQIFAIIIKHFIFIENSSHIVQSFISAYYHQSLTLFVWKVMNLTTININQSKQKCQLTANDVQTFIESIVEAGLDQQACRLVSQSLQKILNAKSLKPSTSQSCIQFFELLYKQIVLLDKRVIEQMKIIKQQLQPYQFSYRDLDSVQNSYNQCQNYLQ